MFRRRSALEALGKLPRDADTDALVLDALRDTSGYVIRTAAEIVERWGLVDAAPVLRQRTGDSDPLTRRSALDALRIVGRAEDIDLLLPLLAHDPDRSVRNAAAWAISALAGQDNWRRAFAALLGDPMPRHRLFACEMAAKFGGAQDREVLRPLLDDEDGHVRKAVARILSETSP